MEVTGIAEVTDVSDVTVRRDDVRLDAERRCAGSFEPVAAVELPEQVEVYRIGDGRGEPVACSGAERVRWSKAAATFLAAVSRALEELYRAHGGAAAAFDLDRGTGAWRAVPPPRHWPGWRRRAVDRSAAAQRAFLTEVQRAAEAYRPVREEVEQRLAEQRTARQADEGARAEETRLRRTALEAVAGRRVWLYEVGESDGLVRVRVFRADVPPAGPATAAPGPGPAAPGPAPAPVLPREPLTAAELEKDLYALSRAGTAGVALRWDDAARAAVEEESREQGLALAFGRWWSEVARHSWTDRRHGPQPIPPPGTRAKAGGGSGGGGRTGSHS
ncbi:hypothetical protein OH807_03500 [Kitasatospora sp. NBC_01560]|uniref:hypothetical protein n=1 Tax=Kitasatospora sp. NBC_01560 TaxID=2975965 RepID=UPI00386B2B95